MDGFTLTKQLKEDDFLKAVPVVIHSSLSGSANESHAQRAGANGYVAKFVPDELGREILKMLSTAAPEGVAPPLAAIAAHLRHCVRAGRFLCCGSQWLQRRRDDALPGFNSLQSFVRPAINTRVDRLTQGNL